MIAQSAGYIAIEIFEGTKEHVTKQWNDWRAEHPRALVYDQNYNYQAPEINDKGVVIQEGQHGLIIFYKGQ